MMADPEPSEPEAGVEILDGRCQGHAVCFLMAPTVFDIDDEGYGQTRNATVRGESFDLAELAASRCPEAAIVVSPVE